MYSYRIFLILIFFIQSFSYLISQEEEITSENIGDCFGAIQTPLGDQIEPTFTGYAGTGNDLAKWSDSLSLEPLNTLWLTFKAPFSGKLNLQGDISTFPLELLIFKLDENENCETIQNKGGELVLKKHYTLESSLNNEIKLAKGESVYLYFNTLEEIKESLNLLASFKIDEKENATSSLVVKEDLRDDASKPSFHIKIRDAKTKLPVESRIIISESKNFNALYTASDILLNRSGYLKLHMKIDAMGYFFRDVNVNIRDENEKELNIYLNPLEKNQQIELEGIQFLPQSSSFTQEAKPKLRRLRDFLALNKDVKIEIQGHVHHVGRNTWNAKRVSRKRAKEVKNYLVQNGIDGDRLSVKGFGNAKMKYPEPENDEQRSANRRVEIKVE